MRNQDMVMTSMTDPRQRWDTDDRFTGVADASAFAAAIEELAALARRPGWVTEDPELHLKPHLGDGAAAGLRLAGCSTGEDGVLDVVAEYSPGTSRADLRQQAWALLGMVAEPAASVREHAEGEAVVFEVVTGIVGDGRFATHGHTLRLALRPASTE
jgi:hypothetical protein